MFNLFRKKEDKKSDFVIEDDKEENDGIMKSLQVNLSRLIAYAESADIKLQREVSVLYYTYFHFFIDFY